MAGLLAKAPSKGLVRAARQAARNFQPSLNGLRLVEF